MNGFSESVQRVANALGMEENVSSWKLVQELCRLHPEYGKSIAEKLQSETEPSSMQSQMVSEWLTTVRDMVVNEIKIVSGRHFILALARHDSNLNDFLTSRGFIDSLKSELEEPYDSIWKPPTSPPAQSNPDPTPLHADDPANDDDDELGRRAFSRVLARRLGLIRKQNIGTKTNTSLILHLHGPWGAGKTTLLNLLKRELKANSAEPGDVKLVRGKAKRRALYGAKAAQATPKNSDPVANQPKSDPTPLHAIATESKEANSDSEKDSPWVVVEFNAWLNQRLTPPWWPLLDAVYRQGSDQLTEGKAKLRFKELWWRWITTNREQVVVGSFVLVLTLLLSVLFFFFWPLLQDVFTPKKKEVSLNLNDAVEIGHLTVAQLKDVLKQGDLARPKEGVEIGHLTVAFLTGLAGVVFAVSKFAGRPFVSGSARGAQAFMQSSVDPMERIARHFRDLISSIGPPVIIFIDDLDRCHAEYVVMLLEGIQTLFRDPGVTYVISADRRWIYTCFEEAYKAFADSVNEPGKRMGGLFLEKAVQLSVSLPRLSSDAQKAYWNYLIYGDQASSKEKRKEADQYATETLRDANTHEELAAKLKSAKSSAKSVDADIGVALREAALREAAVIKLTTEKADIREEAFLKAFAPLLEPNPRGMKRLLNAYSLHRDMAVLAGLDVLGNLDLRKQLALWTIVCIRWPILEEALTENLKYVDVIQLEKPLDKEPELHKLFKEAPESLRNLLIRKSVQEVFWGKGVGVSLQKEAIEAFVSLRTSNSSSAAVV